MTFNAELANKVLEQIREHPETWDQDWWFTETDYGTAYCFAGWACALSGWEPVPGSSVRFRDPETLNTRLVSSLADELLGIRPMPHRDGMLFASSNTLPDLETMVAELSAGQEISHRCDCGCQDTEDDDLNGIEVPW